jgi:hypothetical protein
MERAHATAFQPADAFALLRLRLPLAQGPGRHPGIGAARTEDPGTRIARGWALAVRRDKRPAGESWPLRSDHALTGTIDVASWSIAVCLSGLVT